jgi:hypothetical protein
MHEHAARGTPQPAKEPIGLKLSGQKNSKTRFHLLFSNY